MTQSTRSKLGVRRRKMSQFPPPSSSSRVYALVLIPVCSVLDLHSPSSLILGDWRRGVRASPVDIVYPPSIALLCLLYIHIYCLFLNRLCQFPCRMLSNINRLLRHRVTPLHLFVTPSFHQSPSRPDIDPEQYCAGAIRIITPF